MQKSSLGIAATSYLSVWETIDTLDFLSRSLRFDAAGIQAVVHGEPAAIRERIEEYEMYFEAMVPLPEDDSTERFEQSLKDAKAVGATALRAASLGTRRYESFQTLDAWTHHVEKSKQALEKALPLLERYRIPLGLENHKDWTTDELLEIVCRFSSEYLGVCLDFGNNVSLLEMPMETIARLAPYVVTTHVKDVSLASYDKGILLSEVVLGKGVIDVARAVQWIREARPSARMSLEMITREPLKVPMLMDDYWRTLPTKSGRELARILRFASEQSDLPANSATEDENIARCFDAWRAMKL